MLTSSTVLAGTAKLASPMEGNPTFAKGIWSLAARDISGDGTLAVISAADEDFVSDDFNRSFDVFALDCAPVGTRGIPGLNDYTINGQGSGDALLHGFGLRFAGLPRFRGDDAPELAGLPALPQRSLSDLGLGLSSLRRDHAGHPAALGHDEHPGRLRRHGPIRSRPCIHRRSAFRHQRLDSGSGSSPLREPIHAGL